MELPQIDPSTLEREIRAGTASVVLDVRSEEDFAAWHLDTGSVPLRQRHWQQIVDDPAGVAGWQVAGQPIRVICARGISSEKVVRALIDHGIDATSVRGGMIGWSRLLSHDEVPDVPGVHVEQFRREARGCLSYVVSADGEALVVDPAPDVELYLDFARSKGLTITHVLDTHVHADHLSGLRQLHAATGAATHVSRAAIDRGFVLDGVEALVDGDRIAVGSADVRVISLPGHTSDNIGVMVSGRALIAGDSLFTDSVARPDLEVGDAGAARAAGQLYRTVHERILSLDPATRLLPCHYPGGRVDGPIAPTLREVSETVGLLGLSEAQFVEQSITAMPPRPANYLEIIAVNLGSETSGDVAGLEIGANNCAVASG